MEKYDVVILGGDKRIAYMVPFLEEWGYRVSFDKAAAASAKALIGGIPLLKNGRLNEGNTASEYTGEKALSLLSEGQKLFAGVIPEWFCKGCEASGVECHDFMKVESIAVFNAVATAEGTILEALTGKETNLHKSRCLVTGFGRCGKVLSEKLGGLSARVTVTCRKEEELALADALGFETFALFRLEEEIQRYDYVFNTVPALILDEKVLSKMKKDALIVDIASGTGGTDFEKARQLGIPAKHCLGLPGKYKSIASAKPLAEYVIKNIG